MEAPLTLNSRNRIFLTAVDALGQRSAPTPVEIVQDRTPLDLFIDFPFDGAVLTNESIGVAGRVGDMLSGFMGLAVSVNGEPAEVIVGVGTNGAFQRTGLLLAMGANLITVRATDSVGNPVVRTVSVTRVEVTGPRMAVVSGNNQRGPAKSRLAEPLVVRVTHEDGTPIANKIVTFEVTRSDGRLSSDPGGAGTMTLQFRTGADGFAAAWWILGTDAGCGNSRVTVTSRDISGTTFFCASADPGPASQINIGSGSNQRAEAGGPAPEKLNVWVNDGGNGIPGVPVTFGVDTFTTTVEGFVQDGGESHNRGDHFHHRLRRPSGLRRLRLLFLHH